VYTNFCNVLRRQLCEWVFQGQGLTTFSLNITESGLRKAYLRLGAMNHHKFIWIETHWWNLIII
jgi:hypothetical protein